MNCHEVTGLLFDYQDGSLTSNQLREVQEHLETCLSCNRELKAVRSLLSQAKKLNSGVAPARDLWPEIRTRIAPSSAQVAPSLWPDSRVLQPSNNRLQWLGIAATIGFFGLSLLLSDRWSGFEAPVKSQEAASLGAGQESQSMFDLAAQARVEAGVLQTKKDLFRAVERERAFLGTETVVEVESSIRLIDAAIDQTRAALENFPESPHLNHRLATLYRSESELLKRLSRV